MNIGNERDHYVAQLVGVHVAAPAAEEERRAYARCLPSLHAIGDHYRCEASADVDVAKNVSVAGFANCLRAEVNGPEAGWLVRNEAAARWCGEWSEVWQKSNENAGDARVCETELECGCEHEHESESDYSRTTVEC